MNIHRFDPRLRLASQLALRGVILLSFTLLAGPSPAQEDSKEQAELRARIAGIKQEMDQQKVSMQAMQQEMRQREQEMRRQHAEAEAEFAEAQRQYRELQAKAEASAANDRKVVIFGLKHLPADDAANTISRVLLEGSPSGLVRVAVDERANRLIVSSTAAQVEAVAQLLQDLDVEPKESTQRSSVQAPPEMLQMRVIWLADDPAADKEERAAGKLNEQVLESLRPLGFGSPKIVCQTVTSLVVAKRQQNAFGFATPVELDGSVLRFEGAGNVASNEDGRFLVNVRLSVNAVASGGGGRGAPFTSEVQGAITTPLGNYTILGTSVVVVATPNETAVVPKQVPCAFVLQLNQAADFSAGTEISAARK